MKRTLFPLLAATLMAIACGSNNEKSSTASTVFPEEQNLPGDSTLYGLACEGCTDSLLIVLPAKGGDPDTFSIFDAQMKHQILGRPTIGDKLAVVLNREDSSVADKVINIDRLEGKWCYQVMPRLRRMTADSAGAGRQPVNLPDSLLRRWLQPKEYGYDIRRDYIVRPLGTITSMEEKQRPVEYPPLKRYREWHLFNGRLILSETRHDTAGTSRIMSSDTVDIIRLRRDTLVLRFADREQGFYLKKDEDSK